MDLTDLRSKHVVGYARVSTAEQKKGWSPQVQGETIRTFCARNDLNLVNVFEDLGRSGESVRSRTGLISLLRFLAQGGFGAVIVTKEDRIARQVADAQDIGSEIFATGAAVITLEPLVVDRGPIDTDGVASSGRQLAQILAEDEQDRIRSRVLPTITRQARAGVAGGHVCLGYRRVGKGLFLLDEVLAPVVQEIFARIKAGEALHAIQMDLYQRGIRQPGGNKPISLEQVKVMLRNRWYVGEHRWTVPRSQRAEHGDELLVANHHPVLIDAVLFADVQHVLDQRYNAWKARQSSAQDAEAAPEPRRARRTRVKDLLANEAQPSRGARGIVPPALTHCASCGGRVYAAMHTYGPRGNRTQRPAYQCEAHRRHGASRCPEIEVAGASIDDHVSEVLRKRIASGIYAPLALPMLPPDLSTLDAAILDLRTQAKRLRSAIEATGQPRLVARLADLESLITAKEKERGQSAVMLRAPVGPHWDVLRDFDTAWPTLTNHVKRDIVAWLIERVSIGDKSVRSITWRHAPGDPLLRTGKPSTAQQASYS